MTKETTSEGNTAGEKTALTIIDRKLVDEAATWITAELAATLNLGAQEVGEYVLDKFFHGDPEFAKSRNPHKNGSRDSAGFGQPLLLPSLVALGTARYTPSDGNRSQRLRPDLRVPGGAARSLPGRGWRRGRAARACAVHSGSGSGGGPRPAQRCCRHGSARLARLSPACADRKARSRQCAVRQIAPFVSRSPHATFSAA